MCLYRTHIMGPRCARLILSQTLDEGFERAMPFMLNTAPVAKRGPYGQVSAVQVVGPPRGPFGVAAFKTTRGVIAVPHTHWWDRDAHATAQSHANREAAHYTGRAVATTTRRTIPRMTDMAMARKLMRTSCEQDLSIVNV